MKHSGGFTKGMSNAEKEKIRAATQSREAQQLKKALEGNSGSVEELKAAVGAGDMEKTKEIITKMFADESCAQALRQLEEKFSGK